MKPACYEILRAANNTVSNSEVRVASMVLYKGGVACSRVTFILTSWKLLGGGRWQHMCAWWDHVPTCDISFRSKIWAGEDCI